MSPIGRIEIASASRALVSLIDTEMTRRGVKTSQDKTRTLVPCRACQNKIIFATCHYVLLVTAMTTACLNANGANANRW